MATSYPAHASPRPDFNRKPSHAISEYDLVSDGTSTMTTSSIPQDILAQPQPTSSNLQQPPPLVSPPLSTLDPALDSLTTASGTPDTVDHESLSDEDLAALQAREAAHAASPPPTLTPLPEVTCEVRARIPTTTGQEMFLHLYHNSVDNKEHLAIVFGPYIRSKSLDAPRPGETEKDRMIRGAYVGTLFPGRTSSRLETLKREAGVGGAVQSQGGMTLPMSPVQAPRRSEAEEEEMEKEEEVDPTVAPPFVRIHSECYTGETVWSARCDCGEQLDEAARIMSLSPYGGVIIYLRQEGRGIGLLSKLKAYNLQDLGHDTLQANLLLRHPADARSYGLATAMLVDLGLGGPLGTRERERGIRLLTNNPEKVRAVEGPGREVVVKERVGMVPLAWQSGGEKGVRGKEVEKYISTKIEKFKHMFS